MYVKIKKTESSDLGPMIHLSGAISSTSAYRDGDPDLSTGPGENFSLKLTT